MKEQLINLGRRLTYAVVLSLMLASPIPSSSVFAAYDQVDVSIDNQLTEKRWETADAIDTGSDDITTEPDFSLAFSQTDAYGLPAHQSPATSTGTTATYDISFLDSLGGPHPNQGIVEGWVLAPAGVTSVTFADDSARNDRTVLYAGSDPTTAAVVFDHWDGGDASSVGTGTVDISAYSQNCDGSINVWTRFYLTEDVSNAEGVVKWDIGSGTVAVPSSAMSTYKPAVNCYNYCSAPYDNPQQVLTPQGDCDGDGITNQTEGYDPDGDGDPKTGTTPVDTDNDGIPDYLDLDSDNDGILDSVEKTIDTDADGLGNWRDVDSDGDGISDLLESGLPNASSLDTNNDGMIDGDVNTNGITTAVVNPSDPTKTVDYILADTDKDGISDYLDLDSDNDGILDSVEKGDNATPLDTDGDGTPDFRDLDSDNDGLTDLEESGLPNPDQLDKDGDGMIDGGVNQYGIPESVADPSDPTKTVAYTLADTNGDGIPDYIQANVASSQTAASGLADTGQSAKIILVSAALLLLLFLISKRGLARSAQR